MRILVIGAGRVGARVIKQLRKNPELTILTADPREEPYALSEGVISEIDVREPLTPFTLEHVLRMTQPDLVLLTLSAQDMALGSAPGMELMSEALRDELAAISEVPMIRVARS